MIHKNEVTVFLYGMLTLSFVLMCNCTISEKEKVSIKNYTPEQFAKNRYISGGSFSKKGHKLLYTSDETGLPAAWTYNIKTSKKTLLQRDSLNAVYSLTLYGEDDNLIYIMNPNGGRSMHIYAKEGVQTTNITPGENIRATWRGVNNDFSGIYYLSNVRSPRKFDRYEYNFTTKTSQLIFQNDTKYSTSYNSNNRKYILLHERITEEITNLYLYDIANKRRVSLSPADNDSYFYGKGFSLESNEVYYLTNFNNEFAYFEKYNIKTKERTLIAKEDWDIVNVTFSRDHNFLAIYTNENGRARVKVKDLKKNRFLDIPFLKTAEIEKIRFGPKNRYMSLQVAGYNQPKNIWLLNLQTGEAKQIVSSLNPEIDANDLSYPIDTTITSFDGIKIPAFLYLPKNKAKKTDAALVWTHGGPGGQFRTNYNQYIQYVVNQGYTVLAINNRGSSGYGKTFKALDNQKHGLDDLQDIIEGKKLLASMKDIDENKIGIVGDSYGGYLVLAALTFHPNEFAIGIDMFGISDWLHVLNSIPAFWETRKKALYEEIGHPKHDSIKLYNKSPLFFSDNIKKPLMVVQGAHDPKVLQSQSDSIVARVKSNNVPTKYILFDDEGHGIRKKENQIEVMREIGEFLNQYLN
ncbi:S9 family peptidase [uncultured Winogradskyella sp.]|uniref:S9 family peptidase n=1 Tax=uncultured Winogradskyella sp. TaxID=395353 RepID=UPI002628118F|nr:S9 family peptidase [uncultured Winogradskyella sp.]